MKSQKLLSLSMIVKDEERNIAKCLNSVKDVVDEIVIVDTGSEDNTVETAKRFGAEIYNFPWSDDFSAARNYSLSKCSGKFILYMDADEILAPESIDEIKDILLSGEPEAYRCIIENTASNGNRKSVGKYCRLFPNLEGIAFQGKVHEQIEDSLLKLDVKINNSSITIIHHGYDIPEEDLKEKATRNLSLLLREYENNQNSYYAYHLGLTYSILEDKTSAKKYFEIALSDPDIDKSYSYYCSEFLTNYYLQKREIEKAKEHLDKMFEFGPNKASAYLLSSKLFAALRDYDKASMYAATAFELNETNSKDSSHTVQEILDPQEIINQGLYLALQSNNRNNFFHFVDLYAKISDEKFVDILKSLYNNEQITAEQRLLLEESINDSNISIVLFLLRNYTFPEMTYEITKSLFNKYKKNPDLLLTYTEAMTQLGEKEFAIEMLENNFEQYTNNPAPAFYLMSYYLESAAFQKLERPLDFLGKHFPDDPEVLTALQKFNEQIGILLN